MPYSGELKSWCSVPMVGAAVAVGESVVGWSVGGLGGVFGAVGEAVSETGGACSVTRVTSTEVGETISFVGVVSSTLEGWFVGMTVVSSEFALQETNTNNATENRPPKICFTNEPLLNFFGIVRQLL